MAISAPRSVARALCVPATQPAAALSASGARPGAISSANAFAW